MSPAMINIAVLHADSAQCEALCDFIADAGFRVVGGRATGPDCLDLMRTATTHVLVLDFESFADEAGTLLSAVRAASPGTGILVLLRGESPAHLDELTARGAGGFIDGQRAGMDLPAALRTIAMGRRYLPAAAAPVSAPLE